ncbi:MAG: FtsK/SpoIIIE domain-containing protein [Actinomycetota bacterium]
MDVEELKQRASTCAASGDLDGEVDAYRQADDLGDAEASILLGDALRKKGDLAEARRAYERGEMRGHREAAMSLGNLLSDLGDKPGAKSAYLRSIDQGSTIAALNLGLMLAGDGDHDEALLYLQRAADQGDSGGFWGIGKINEQRQDWTAAAAAYRQGAELGDAACAYGLGVALYELGDRDGSRAAFQQAKDLGHEAARDLLEAFDREDGAPGGATGTSVGQLWSEVTGVLGALASHRQELGRQWIEATLVVQQCQSQVAALKAADDDVRKRYTTVTGRFKVNPPTTRANRTPVPSASPDQWLAAKAGQSGAWQLAPEQAHAFDSDLEQARTALLQAENKRLRVDLRSRGIEALGRVKQRLDGLAAAIQAAAQGVRDAEHSRETSCWAGADQARSAFDPVATRSASSALQLPTLLQPWSSPSWESWSRDNSSNLGLRLCYGGVLSPKADQRLGSNADFGTNLRIPWGFTLHENWWLQHDGPARAAAHGFVRSMMLRQLLSVSPGEVKFCIFDPVGLGQSAGVLLDLAEYDADLIGGKVWSSAQDFEARLADLSAHIELVIQKYLRTTYQTIDEFNDAAGEIAEPYRMLVIFDFPTGMKGESAARLKTIIENGPRCGVFTLVVHDSSAQVPYGVEIDQLRSISIRSINFQAGFAVTGNGYQLEAAFEHDVLPERSEIAKRIIDSVGRASIARTEAAVTFDKVFAMYGDVAARGLRPEFGTAPTLTSAANPHTWWSDDSIRGLFAPIGQKGARDVAILGFDSGDHAGALLVGRPGSGKSTLLHAYLGGLTTLYGPDELELYLIDFKEGVEFKAYAEERLPHAKVIAIESDREFGLSVLESLQAEITQRAEILRSTGGRQAGVQGLREATGDKFPRILLVFDEFQVLFARNDKVGLAAADLLESIIRQGRGFGVHVLLGSQSLAGLDALGAHVPQLLPVRILLPAAESDARKVLGDNNNAGDYLTSHGEGILNSAGGAVEANERFKGALLTEADRVARLQVLRNKADERGFTRVPMVFEGNSLVPLESQSPRKFREELAASGSYPIRIRTGKPMTVGDVGDLVLPREASANVLAIVRSGDNQDGIVPSPEGPAYGLLAAAVTSGAMTSARVDVIDFMSNDDGADLMFLPLLDARRISLKRRRAFPDVLSDYLDEVDERLDQDDSSRATCLLVLFGVHRARDLDAEMGSLDVDVDLVENLERIMRDGPEVGVHVWLWSDSVSGASRRLTPRMMREIAWRIAGKMSADDSQTFIGTNQAADLRKSQLLMVNEDRGVATRVTAYAPPPTSWVAQVTAAMLTG